MRAIKSYCEFDIFYERFKPETPLGKDYKDCENFIYKKEELEKIWKETDVLLDFLKHSENAEYLKGRIVYHLRRIPRLPECTGKTFDEVEIFQFKKFLFNFKALWTLLPKEILSHFSISYVSFPLERQLDLGTQSAESFFLTDEYSSKLTGLRNLIRSLNKEIAGIKKERENLILKQYRLEFNGKSFLLIKKAIITEELKDLLYIDLYDEEFSIARIKESANELVLKERLQILLQDERSEEAAILEMLTHEIVNEKENFLDYEKTLTTFDVSFARALLALTYAMTRPEVSDSKISIINGTYIVCKERALERGSEYFPLSYSFTQNANVIFGSNMGGKTIVLKTISFLQLCMQSGFFVPAEKYSAPFFLSMHYIGELKNQKDVEGVESSIVNNGLSGFGFEIMQYLQAEKDLSDKAFLIFDEFARTTNSLEAEALLSAIVHKITRSTTSKAFFATHFRGIERLSSASFLRMKGLIKNRLKDTNELLLIDRIKSINTAMDFSLEEDGCGDFPCDAIQVAAHLGLDSELVSYAMRIFNKVSDLEN